MSFNQGLFSKSIISITRQEGPLITQFASTFINKMDVLTKVVKKQKGWDYQKTVFINAKANVFLSAAFDLVT